MKKTIEVFALIIIATALSQCASAAPVYTSKVMRPPLILNIVAVTDGDTIKTEMPQLPSPLNRVSIRVLHIDTPETHSRAKCTKEALAGEAATEFAKNFVGTSKTMTVTNYKWDKYGGRVLGDVEINGKDLASAIITAGLAVRYEGAKKSDWCK